MDYRVQLQSNVDEEEGKYTEAKPRGTCPFSESTLRHCLVGLNLNRSERSLFPLQMFKDLNLVGLIRTTMWCEVDIVRTKCGAE